MKFMVIVKASKASEAGEMPSQQLLTDMGNYNQSLVDAGIMLAGEGLQASSKGARVKFSGKNRTVTDGPFPETKELIAGFWIWQVKSLAEAIEWVKRCPNPHDEETELEIRQIFGADDFGPEFTPELREQEAGLRAKGLGLGAVRFEQLPERRIAGRNESYTKETRSNIPKQWQSFAPKLGHIPGQVGKDSYGVCWNAKPDCAFDYLTGVEVGVKAGLPADFTAVTVPAGRYAVFTHDGPIATFPKTLETIWKKWVPDAGLKTADGPCVERYPADFCPESEHGGAEIWIPLQS